MKYIKLFEYIPRQKKVEFKFKEGDYVNLIRDNVNGAPVKDISKKVFRIDRSRNTKEFSYFNYYLLRDVNDEYLSWVKEDTIRPSTKKEIEEAKLKNIANKYNL